MLLCGTNNDEQGKIELLSQWKLEAEFCNQTVVECGHLGVRVDVVAGVERGGEHWTKLSSVIIVIVIIVIVTIGFVIIFSEYLS